MMMMMMMLMETNKDGDDDDQNPNIKKPDSLHVWLDCHHVSGCIQKERIGRFEFGNRILFFYKCMSTSFLTKTNSYDDEK